MGLFLFYTHNTTTHVNTTQHSDPAQLNASLPCPNKYCLRVLYTISSPFLTFNHSYSLSTQQLIHYLNVFLPLIPSSKTLFYLVRSIQLAVIYSLSDSTLKVRLIIIYPFKINTLNLSQIILTTHHKCYSQYHSHHPPIYLFQIGFLIDKKPSHRVLSPLCYCTN